MILYKRHIICLVSMLLIYHIQQFMVVGVNGNHLDLATKHAEEEFSDATDSARILLLLMEVETVRVDQSNQGLATVNLVQVGILY